MPELAASSDHPLISVVMPVYNAEKYVGEAISSILAQTYSHLEFIIVDDGSTDSTADILRQFAARDARIRLLFLEHGGGPRAANAGVKTARGDLIARMDADDIALPERFEIQIAWMKNKRVDICGSCVKRFGAEDTLIWFPETHQAIRYELLFRPALLHPTVIMRADIARSHPYDEQTHFDDYELWTRLAPLYCMGNVPQVLLKRRSHPRQISLLEASEFRDDRRKFRRRYFQNQFPQATEKDYTVLTQVAERESFKTLADLERAGMWLVRLAQTPDAFLRRRMLYRWRATCQRSAQLGLGTFRLYRHIAPQFGISPVPDSRRLALTCALRLTPESKWYASLARYKRRLPSSRLWEEHQV